MLGRTLGEVVGNFPSFLEEVTMSADPESVQLRNYCEEDSQLSFFLSLSLSLSFSTHTHTHAHTHTQKLSCVVTKMHYNGIFGK